MRLASIFLTLTALLFSAAACSDRRRPEKLPVRTSPIPEAVQPAFPEHPVNEADATPKGVKDLLKGPLPIRFSTPGRVRWYLDFDAPATMIRWSPLKGFSVSAGKEVLNVTSRGELRWRQVAGAGHQVFTIDTIEAVWSPAFSTIRELGRRGLSGWSRDWNGGVIGDDRGVFLFDASTVAALGADGQDQWRIALEGIRKVEGPFTCRGGVVFHGKSGLKRQAVQVSAQGTVLRVTELNRGSQLLGVSDACDPLVWRDGTLRLVSERGIARWSRQYPNAPLVYRLEGGFLITAGRAALPADVEIVSDDGRTTNSGKLPVNGRLCRADAVVANGLDVQVMGFCLDVTHPCAKPDGDRGPYNALVTSDGKGGFRPFVRHTAGHMGAAAMPDGGFLTAGSKEEDATDVEMRDRNHAVVWQTALPGRMSAGPYLGPYGGVYIATCSGWECAPPFRLFSITTAKDQDDDEDGPAVGEATADGPAASP